MDRRRFLLGVGGLLSVTAGCSDTATEYGDWFENVDNYDGEADRTGVDRTTVAVGAGDGLAFEPAAIRITTGTTVLWEWTGTAGRHNVVARGGTFESPYHERAGATYEYTFSSTGLYPYYCEPHREAGMKGGVRVV